jgi:hypothetical protein
MTYYAPEDAMLEMQAQARRIEQLSANLEVALDMCGKAGVEVLDVKIADTPNGREIWVYTQEHGRFNVESDYVYDQLFEMCQDLIAKVDQNLKIGSK